MIYPPSFKYEIVKDDNVNITLRCDVKSMEDINVWVAEFGKINYLNWNVRILVFQMGSELCVRKYFILYLHYYLCCRNLN